ncbi:HD-GYP domain-containing protein [Desulfobacter latus]|uniref:HD domain-containing protein n=1 Tax=Desulfobacter latus TaxID=2292 RepID=A0A850T895_9BACT|nr:HD domain-containing phosphohydrolase [Desulfobacter latus]NWH03586.1 HD domain-containing protein [Desulfobacter latus]
MDLKTEYFDDGSSFYPIDPLMLNPEYLEEFAIFERYPKKDNLYRFRCLIMDFDSTPIETVIKLLKSWKVVYIHKKHLTSYEAHIKENLGYILMLDKLETKKKTKVFTQVSTNVIKDVFDSHYNDSVISPKAIEKVEKLVSQVIDFISDSNSLECLAELIGHDYNTHVHSIKVGWILAAFINANKDLFKASYDLDLKSLLIKATVAGFMHDIGKIKIPENILNKRGKLDNLEYITVQSHTSYSLSLLFESGLPKFAMQAILYHHESEDGSGYPCGLKGDQIPLIAKAIHIIDVFEALTAERPYKKAKTPFEALRIMMGENPQVEVLNKFEQEARQNKKAPIEAIVRNERDVKIQRLKERMMLEEEAKKRVEVRLKLRDRGMAHCFDKELMKRFIITINESKSFNLSELI